MCTHVHPHVYGMCTACVWHAQVRRALLEDEAGFVTATLSGTGPSLFAVRRPPGLEAAEAAEAVEAPEAAGAFAARFERECAERRGVAVRVWACEFAPPPAAAADGSEGARSGALQLQLLREPLGSRLDD